MLVFQVANSTFNIMATQAAADFSVGFGFPGWSEIRQEIQKVVNSAMGEFTKEIDHKINEVKSSLEEQIRSLQDQIESLKHQTTDLKQQIESLQHQTTSLEQQIRQHIAEEIESVNKNLEKEIENVTKNLEKVIENLKKEIFILDPAEILDKGVKDITLVSPDHWSVKIGVVCVSFHGFNACEADKLLGYTKKLFERTYADAASGDSIKAIKDIAQFDADALEPFIKAATSVDIQIEGSLFSTAFRAGISWGYSNPGEKTGEIIGLIKKLTH